MRIKQKLKDYNHSSFLLLPLVEGINFILLGENLIDCFISKNTKDYSLYVATHEETPLLEEHQQTMNCVYDEDKDCYIYKLHIDSIWYKDIRSIRENRLSKLSRDLLDRAEWGSGLTKKDIENPLTFYIYRKSLDRNILRYFYIHTRYLYESILENPHFNINNTSGINCYENIEYLNDTIKEKINSGKEDREEAQILLDLFIGEPIIVQETEFIESFT